MTKDYTVPAIHRAIRVLEILAASHTGFSLAELARQTNIPKSSLFRILLTLEQSSLVLQDHARNVYTLGMKLIDWGNTALDKIDLKTVAHPHLMRLAHETRESFYLAILDDYEVIIIDRADTPEIWRMVTRLGQRSPVHVTATGQVILADMGPEAFDTIVARGLKKFTPRSITTPPRLKKRIYEVKKLGYSVTDAEYKPDLCAIAVPIRDHRGKVTAALMTALQSERTRKNKAIIPDMVAVLKREANAISHQIGFQEQAATEAESTLKESA